MTVIDIHIRLRAREHSKLPRAHHYCATHKHINMADDTRDTKSQLVGAALSEMKLEEGDWLSDAEDTVTRSGTYDAPTPEAIKRSRSPTPTASKSASQSPIKKQSTSQSPKSEESGEEIIAGDITVSAEPGKAPKLSRKGSQKVVARSPRLFSHMEDSTDEAISIFQVIKDCIYGSKFMGSSDHDALDCDCSEEWSEYFWLDGATNADRSSRQ